MTGSGANKGWQSERLLGKGCSAAMVVERVDVERQSGRGRQRASESAAIDASFVGV